VQIRQRTTEQGSLPGIHLRNVVEDRCFDGPPVPDKTGGLAQMNQAASDERGTEKNFSPQMVFYALILSRQSQSLRYFLHAAHRLVGRALRRRGVNECLKAIQDGPCFVT